MSMQDAPVATLTSPVMAAGAVDASKVYGKGESEVRAIDGVSVGFEQGKFTAIMGPSGSGKSTLMHCVAGLDRLSGGDVFIGDTYLSTLNEKNLTQLRRDKIGFIFQSFNLVPTLNALENIVLPMALGRRRPDPDWLHDLVWAVGLQDRLDHRPSELSGGQQQRVAVARALLSRPDLVLADEPTGNLDSRAGTQVLDLLRGAVQEFGQTIVVVTHDPNIAAHLARTVHLGPRASTSVVTRAH